jgi:hypothetical protein
MADIVSPQVQGHAASEARRVGQPVAAGPASWLDTIGAREASSPDAVPEAIEAGFARDPEDVYPVRGRAGFEAGGPADLMGPCSVLAELTGQARDRMSELTDDELVGVLRAARRVQSWQAALELEAVSELAARRLAEPARPGPRPADRLAAELAAALTLTVRSADSLVDVATSVERLSGVRDSLAGGQIDLSRARVFADELCVLDWLKATRIAAKLVLEAPGLTTAQLQARLRRAVLAADPEAGRRRQKAAKDKARVQTWQESSGNAALAGRELPPAGVLAADRHLTALAKAMKAAGAAGTLDQLRGAIYLALLSGQDPSIVLSSQAADSDAGGAGPAGHADPAAGAGSAGCAASAGDTRSAGDGRAESPSTPAAGSEAAAVADTELPGADAESPGADTESPGLALSWPAGPIGTIHLTMPLSAWLGQTNNPGEVAGHGPVDAWTCRDIAGQLGSLPGTRCCLTLVTDDGYAVGHACARTPPPRPDPRVVRQWLRGLTPDWLSTGTDSTGTDCDHAGQSAGYRPAARLAHLVKIRNPACTAPGCRRSAHSCDLDHLVPYDRGGRTCWCNLHPACRRDHQLKQEPGWHAEMSPDGMVTWSLPHGRAYTTKPEPYPV